MLVAAKVGFNFFYMIDKLQLLEIIFDLKYGSINGCSILSKEDYAKFKKWSISSGYFEFCLYCEVCQKQK